MYSHLGYLLKQLDMVMKGAEGEAHALEPWLFCASQSRS